MADDKAGSSSVDAGKLLENLEPGDAAAACLGFAAGIAIDIATHGASIVPLASAAVMGATGAVGLKRTAELAFKFAFDREKREPRLSLKVDRLREAMERDDPFFLKDPALKESRYYSRQRANLIKRLDYATSVSKITRNDAKLETAYDEIYADFILLTEPPRLTIAAPGARWEYLRIDDGEFSRNLYTGEEFVRKAGEVDWVAVPD